jgi:hypothetical protein
VGRLTIRVANHGKFCQITGTGEIMGNSAKSLAHCLQKDNSAKSLAQAILPNHWHAPPHSGYSAKSLAQPILPNHWHAPPHTGNSAKSLAHCPSWRSLASTVILPYHWHRQFCQSLACSSKCRLFCQIIGTGTSAKSLAQATLSNHWHTVSTDRQFCQIAILPNHWHTPPHSGNSAKSLACSSTDRQFCQITGTGISAKSLACSSTYWIFCQITGTLSIDRQFCQITGTGNSAISLARSSTCRLFCQIGTLCPQTDNSAESLAQAIMGNCAKSLTHCLQKDNSAKSLAQAILPNHWHAPPH